MKIYRRQYDNPITANGTKKQNKYLGNFTITKTIRESDYDSIYIGIKKNERYLIIETEVCGINGGSKFEVYKLKD